MNMSNITLDKLNQLLRVDGINVKAIDQLDSLPKETLIKALAYIIGELENK